MDLVYVMHTIVTHFGYDCFITTKLIGSITLSLEQSEKETAYAYSN